MTGMYMYELLRKTCNKMEEEHVCFNVYCELKTKYTFLFEIWYIDKCTYVNIYLEISS